MQIYVGTYAKYNQGSLKGAWLNVENYSDKEEFLKACAALHADESDPELMFQDWEDIPNNQEIVSESHISDKVFELAQMAESDRALLCMYREQVIGDVDATLEQAQEAFRGEYDKRGDYACELSEESGDMANVPQHIACHIDWDLVARDMAWNGDVTFVEHGGDCWVFSNN